MKKEYLSPEVDVNLIHLEVNFLASDTESGAQDLIIDDIIDASWIF